MDVVVLHLPKLKEFAPENLQRRGPQQEVVRLPGRIIEKSGVSICISIIR